MTKSIISLLLLLCSLPVFSQDSVQVAYDSSYIEERTIDESKIGEYQEDSDFEYGTRPKPEMSLWDRFKLWLGQLLQKLFYMGTETPIGKVIVYILCGIIIVYAIKKLIEIKSGKLFFSAKEKGLGHEVFHEDIHEMDFDKLINEAISEGDYRLAIRLIYLHALKHLSDRQFINWQPGKTNYDYVSELNQQELKPGFGDLSFYFDYAWYGDFNVNKGLFEKVNTLFNNWKQKL